MKRATLAIMDEHWMYTVQDYVQLEDGSDLKHEYFGGDIRAMGGGTPEHARLGAALVGQLVGQLADHRCEVFSSDLRVRIGELITYPDASVVCGDVQLDLEDPNAQLNPTVLFEVTSPSSERYDRRGKFARYKLIPALREYVVIAHRAQAIDVFRRGDDGAWRDVPDTYGPGERARLESIGCELDVDALYRRKR